MMEVVQSIRICEQAMEKYAKLQTEWEAVQKELGEEATKDPKGAAAGKLNELAKTKYSHRIEPARTAYAQGLAAYGESDLLCYRAEAPPAPAARGAARHASSTPPAAAAAREGRPNSPAPDPAAPP